MTAVDVLAAAALDAALGDPRWLPHPVRAMGAVIAWCDEQVRRLCRSPRSLRAAGLCLALVLPASIYLAAQFLIEAAGSSSSSLGHAVTIGLASTTLAGRDLLDHVQSVSRALRGGNVSGARQAVGMIVGRDTDDLPEDELVRATVETIAESTADGVIAPLLYLAVGGAPLALAYKAVNTLDSMVGHRDERHLHFGWASARLDDLANWIPARATAGLIVVGSGIAGGQWSRMRDSWRILLRDGHRHPSPNSGRPEAAMAGALGVQLGGVNYYDGCPQERPRLGDSKRMLTPSDIAEASRIMIASYVLGLLLVVAALWLA
jgi:adenosylcobinamide-phosphate synthase